MGSLIGSSPCSIRVSPCDWITCKLVPSSKACRPPAQSNLKRCGLTQARPRSSRPCHPPSHFGGSEKEISSTPRLVSDTVTTFTFLFLFCDFLVDDPVSGDTSEYPRITSLFTTISLRATFFPRSTASSHRVHDIALLPLGPGPIVSTPAFWPLNASVLSTAGTPDPQPHTPRALFPAPLADHPSRPRACLSRGASIAVGVGCICGLRGRCRVMNK